MNACVSVIEEMFKSFMIAMALYGLAVAAGTAVILVVVIRSLRESRRESRQESSPEEPPARTQQRPVRTGTVCPPPDEAPVRRLDMGDMFGQPTAQFPVIHVRPEDIVRQDDIDTFDLTEVRQAAAAAAQTRFDIRRQL